MMTEFLSLTSRTYAHPGWNGPGSGGGPGWWLIFPVLFWLVVLSAVGYLAWRRSPAQQGRSAGERALAERYARGEITEDELKLRRGVLRGK